MLIIANQWCWHLAVEAVGKRIDGRNIALKQEHLSIPSQRSARMLNYFSTLKRRRFHAQRVLKWLMLRTAARIAALPCYPWHCSEHLTIWLYLHHHRAGRSESGQTFPPYADLHQIWPNCQVLSRPCGRLQVVSLHKPKHSGADQ